MKRICLLLMLLALCACFFQGCTGKASAIENGDLVFVGFRADSSAAQGSMDEAIVSATGSGEVNMVHVAIVEVEGDSLWIIDATRRRGVSRYPLDEFIKDNTGRRGSSVLVVRRMKDNSLAAEWIERAKTFLGQPYDSLFLPDNGAMYCSELVRESFLSAGGEHLLEDKPMNFKGPDGEYPLYWKNLFEGLGMDVPQGVPGTNPHDMSNSPQLYSPGITLP